MKTGKYIPLGSYNNVKMGYGTVDYRNLKTIYLRLNSWLLPKNETDDYNKIILSSRKKIKQIIYETKNNNFKEESIVDLDVRTKGIRVKKKSFMNLEITLYVNNSIEMKSCETKEYIKNILYKIIDDGLTNKSLFNFYKTKR